MPVIDFRKNADKLFTTVFYRVRAAMRSGKRFFVNYGGGGSSKSVSQHQSELINLLKDDWHCDILIMRKVAADIYDSCYKLLENTATSWGVYDQFTWTFSQGKRQIVNKKTGRRILFRGADDINKLKSIVGIGRVVLEEADAFEFTDFKEINRRTRGIPNIQIVFILNPVDEEHWIKKYFVDEPDGNPGENGNPPIGAYYPRSVFCHSTYLDNKFLTKEDEEELLALKDIDENDYLIYALGKWGRLKTGAEFYPHFNEAKHVGKFPFVPGFPVHLSYDFNSVPYMTLLCMQYIEFEDDDLIRIRLFKEYCLATPLNTTTLVSQAFLDDYEKQITDLFYYGDASGNSKIAGKGDAVNFDDVRAALVRHVYDSSDRTGTYNKPVMKRRKLVLHFLTDRLKWGKRRVIFEVDSSCYNTIKDFKYLKLGPNGKLKEMEVRRGVKFQAYGHTTDAFEYFFCDIFDSLM